MLQNIWTFPNRSVQTFRFVYHRSSWSKSVRSSFGRTIMEKAIWENPFAARLGKGFQLECLFIHRDKGFFLFVCVNDIKLAGKNQNWTSTDIVGHLKNHDWIQNFRRSNGKNMPGNLSISSWSYDMEGHAKKCVERFLWVGKQDGSTTLQSIYSMHWRPSFQRGKLKSVGELSRVCSQIVLKCWNLARIRRPEILWSKNKFARSITKWTRACDKRLCRLISYIHHACENI